MRPFSLLVKPAGADCNLRCAYCFYLERAELYPETPRQRMTQPVLERMVQSYLATEQPQYVFGWQGGEPTLMGLEFFREVTRLQERHGRAGAVVANGLQTNAVLIDDAWAEHLARYRFLVGVSLDGPEEIHDRYRVNAGGSGSYREVMRGLECLRRHGVEHNALVLVSEANCGRPREVYEFLLEQGLAHQQYIPCVEWNAAGRRAPFAVRGEAWGDFLCEIFDQWYPAHVGKVSVRLFDSVLDFLLTGRRNVCTMGQDCRQYFVVEHNGDVYPCDFFVEAERRLGNVMSEGWEELQEAPAYREFGGLKAQWAARCGECEYLALCAGDCLKHRFRQGADPRQLSALCEGWRRFYRHALPDLKRLAGEMRRPPAQAVGGPQPDAHLATEAETPHVGRNDPCPCGSGRKYKKCCGSGGG